MGQTINAIGNFLRETLRPVATYTLVLGQLGLGVMWAFGHVEAKDASAMLGPFTMMAVTFYFKARDAATPSGN